MKKYYTVILISVWLFSAPISGEGSRNTGYFITPVYQDAFFYYQDAGGNDDEFWKSQNFYNVRYAGLNTGYRFRNGETGLFASGRHRITSRYTLHTKTYDDYLNLGPSYLYYANTIFSLEAGRLYHRSDDEGFFLSGEFPGMRSYLSGFGFLKGFRLSFLYLDLAREEILRSKKKGSASEISGLELEYEGRNFHAALFGGTYHADGRPLVPDFRYGSEAEALLPTGQSGEYYTGIHYYMLRASYDAARSMKLKFTGIYHEGVQKDLFFSSIHHEIQPFEIKGGMAYASILYRFQKHQYSDDCSAFNPVLCAVPAVENGPEAEISGLVTSKDRDDRDSSFNGFGSLRPSVSVMGGPVSILLNGNFEHDSPFRNFQPGHVFYNGPLEEKEFRDNTDPSHPDFSRRMEMASIRTAFVVKKNTVNVLFSGAEYGDTSGKEAVILLSRKINFSKINAALFAGAAAASVERIRKSPGLFSDQFEKEECSNYIRYVTGIFFRI